MDSLRNTLASSVQPLARCPCQIKSSRCSISRFNCEIAHQTIYGGMDLTFCTRIRQTGLQIRQQIQASSNERVSQFTSYHRILVSAPSMKDFQTSSGLETRRKQPSEEPQAERYPTILWRLRPINESGWALIPIRTGRQRKTSSFYRRNFTSNHTASEISSSSLFSRWPTGYAVQFETAVLIVNALNVVRCILQSCVTCARFANLSYEPMMRPLPEHRITPSKPFAHLGIDFVGLIQVKMKITSKTTEKLYLALLVFPTTAVHLEVASDLSTTACIALLKRFVAKRGVPKAFFPIMAQIL